MRILDKFIGTFPVSVVVKTATTSVSVGTDAVLSATNGSLQLFSVASVASNGEPASEFFTVGYAGATATATVAIATGARLTATGAVDVLVNGEAIAEMSASTERELGSSPPDPTQTAAAIAITNAQLTATATLAAGASISAGTSANIQVTGTVTSSASATSGNTNNGTVGIAIALGLSNATLTTTVNGSVTAYSGPGTDVGLTIDPTVTDPTAAGYVDMTNHTINVGPHSMLTGDPVTYLNAGGDSIGGPLLGLVNGQTYYVIRLAGQPDEIQVAQSLSDALLGNPYLFGELYLPISAPTSARS